MLLWLSQVIASTFAFVVPLVLWPWAISRLLQSYQIASAGIVGFISGPLWAGWFLGLLVILFPGRSLWFFTVLLVALPILLLVFGALRKSDAPKLSAPFRLVDAPPLAVGAVIVSLLVFYTVAIPTRQHDILIVDILAERLKLSWDFWGLPRYAPDASGFFYPLSHPPAMMSLLAWIKSFASFGWVERAPSAYLVAAFMVGMFKAAESMESGAGKWSLFLLLSPPLLLSMITDNSQDIFRYASFAAALVVLAAKDRGVKEAIVAGALVGLAASYHSLQLPFVFLIPFVLLLANKFSRRSWGGTAAMLAGGITVAIYPYLANMVKVGRPLIKSASVYHLPNMNMVLHETMSAYTNLGVDWSAWELRRLHLLAPGNSGFLGFAFLISLFLGMGFRTLRPQANFSQTVWWAFSFASGIFLLIILDPGSLIYKNTGYGFWSNLRYGQTVLPVMAPVAAVVLERLSRSTGRYVAPLLALLASFGCLYFSYPKVTLGAKYPTEPGQNCLFCTDDEKLGNLQGNGAFQAAQWLKKEPSNRCLTFREAEYFNWSGLNGFPYYTPLAEKVLSAASATEASAVLLAGGANCVLIDRQGAFRASLEKFPAFMGLSTSPTVWTAEFYDVEVWMVGRERLRDEPVIPIRYVSGASQSIDLPDSVSRSGDIHLAWVGEGPVHLVAFYLADDRLERFFIRLDLESKGIKIPVVGNPGNSGVRLWFSAPVSLTTAGYSPYSFVESK